MIVLGIDIGKSLTATCSLYDGNGRKLADLCQDCSETILQSIGCAKPSSALERFRKAKAEMAELELYRMRGENVPNEEE